MNQILMVEKAKREKGAPLDVETVVRIFAIAIMVFGIFMMASGVIALTTNQEEEEQNSNPVVTMEQQANKIIVNIKHDKAIDKIYYNWNSDCLLYTSGQETILPGNEIVYYPYSLEEEHLVKDYEQTTNGIDITEIMTTESGYLQSPKLAYGEYIILETSVPREQKVATPFLVAIEEACDELQELRFIIDKDFKTKVKIYTNDQKTGNAILGKHIEYVIRNTQTGNLMTVKGLDQNQNIVEYGTEENPFRVLNTGYFLTPMELPIGKYVLEQQMAGEGYVKDVYKRQ